PGVVSAGVFQGNAVISCATNQVESFLNGDVSGEAENCARSTCGSVGVLNIGDSGGGTEGVVVIDDQSGGFGADCIDKGDSGVRVVAGQGLVAGTGFGYVEVASDAA